MIETLLDFFQKMAKGLEVLCVSRMNGRTRTKFYKEMIDDEGEFCKECGVPGKDKQLVIDHIDNNNSNNNRKNRRFLCRSCNYKKNPRGPVDKCVSESAFEDETELQNSKKNEPLVRRYIFHRLNENGGNPIPETDLLNSAAERIGNSPVTCKRYLNKMCSPEGVLQRKLSGKTTVIGYKRELDLV